MRLAFKQLPLPFHQFAHGGGRGGAGGQGAGQVLGDARRDVQEPAGADRAADWRSTRPQIGLNVDKFKADLDSDKWKEKVDAEMKEGNKIGANGTPNFFINGKNFVGAQPYEPFKAKIEDAIKDADAHAHGGNYAKLLRRAHEDGEGRSRAGAGRRRPAGGQQDLQGRRG